ncbi:MAG: hypothetical protein ABIC40_02395, partial [bacterium]
SQVASESPGIQVLIPNGGEEWEALTMHDITWTAPPSMQYVDIYYSKDDFGSDVNLIESDVPNTGLYSWEVANDPSETVKVKVTQAGGGQEDVSDDYFSILEVTCDFGTDGWTLAQDYANVPGVWSHTGILCTYNDPVQKIIGHSWPSDGAGGIIKVFDASNPLAGAVATYDTGDLIYCNNDQAMWIDKFSEPGVDRIAYNNFGSGSPTVGYQLKIIDWDGTSFGTPQTLPKSGSIWSLCFTPDGDIILHNAQSVNPSFYFLDKSNGYNYSLMFTLQQSTCDYGSVGNIRGIVYDPEIDAVLMFCNNTSVSMGGQLFALSLTGQLLFEDLEVFDIQDPNKLGFRVGINIDLQSPACRVVLYGSEDNSSNQSLSWRFARYSGDLDEKATYSISAPYYGPCRGDIAADGTLWASPHTGTAHFYKFTQPPDW